MNLGISCESKVALEAGVWAPHYNFIIILLLAQSLFTMPIRRALRVCLIPQRLDSVKAHLANRMAKAGNICLTLNLWSESINEVLFWNDGPIG